MNKVRSIEKGKYGRISSRDCLQWAHLKEICSTSSKEPLKKKTKPQIQAIRWLYESPINLLYILGKNMFKSETQKIWNATLYCDLWPVTFSVYDISFLPRSTPCWSSPSSEFLHAPIRYWTWHCSAILSITSTWSLIGNLIAAFV